MAFTGPGIACDWLDIEGPLHEVWPPRSHQLLFGDLPLAEFKAAEHPGVRPPARLKVRQLGGQNRPDPGARPLDRPQRATRWPMPTACWRPSCRSPSAGPSTKQRGSSTCQRVKERLKAGDCFETAMRWAYRRPSARPTSSITSNRPTSPDDHALACRLSYFFWNSLPDEPLAKLAAAGKLRQPEVLHAEVERLLQDPQVAAVRRGLSRPVAEAAADRRERPGPEALSRVQPVPAGLDGRRNAGLLPRAARQEPRRHASGEVAFAMLNEKLAVHYGIPGVSGSQMRRVELPADCPRGGFLTQAAILKITANGTTTSPVPRGAFVMDRLLGQPPEPPPPNMPAIEPDVRGATTIREQLDKHRAHAACASCHAKIDPPGFALESFDVIGGFRTRYRSIGEGDPAPRGSIDPFIGISFKLGPPVDASGKLPDGSEFRSVREYQDLLAKESGRLLRNLARQLVVFATGREVRFSDRPALDDIVSRTQARGGGLRTLLHEVVQSPLFTGKTAERPRDDKPTVFALAPPDPQSRSRMMIASALPEVGPVEKYVATVIPAPEPAAVKPVVIDGTSTVTVRVIGLFEEARGEELKKALEKIPEVKLQRLDCERAEATVAYDPNCDWLKGAPADQLIERINNRLRDLTRHTMALKPLSEFPRDRLERIEIPILGLDCQACCLAAYESLAQTDGVEQAIASFRRSLAVAWIDPAKTNRMALEQALERRGVTLVKPEAK